MPDGDIVEEWDAEAGDISEPEPLPVEGIVPLGYDRGIFYYLSLAAKQVYSIPAQQHTNKILMAMASVPYYWQRTQFVTKTGIAWDAAIDDLMSKCRDVGVFDPARIRGRGAWIDDGRSVLHLGGYLIVDGDKQPLMLAGSRYVYEAGKQLFSGVPAPLSSKSANELVKLCQQLRWEKPIHGVLLAGWLAVAPVCGGLAWRPSIWLTGGAGSGKSYVQDNIIAPALGGTALRVQSKTSEAGIRQALNGDARPVVFDEAEREDSASAARMQGVLDLVRQSSSESAAEIIKGTQNQTAAKRYWVRSCFLFASINVGIEHRADETRVTVLTLREPDPKKSAAEAAAFAALHARAIATLTPEFAGALLARSVRLLPTIRANAETFAKAIALHLGSRRAGDQLGALLAGAYSLHSEREISEDEAAKYVASQDWTAERGEDEPDERRLLAHLTQRRVRISTGNGGSVECTIGRLIEAAMGRDERISADVAASELAQMGYRMDGAEGIFVATSHPAIREGLRGTPWAAGWSRSLARLPGAGPHPKALRFGPGFVGKATYVPMEAVISYKVAA